MLREKQRLCREIGWLNNQIISILKRWPITAIDTHQSAQSWSDYLDNWRQDPECGLPATELHIMANMIGELNLLEQHLASWEQHMEQEELRHREQAQQAGRYTLFDQLRQYRGIGTEISRTFDWFIGDLARFRNGAAFASYLGLTPTPYSSGKMNRDQGISKQGDKELRRLLIQLAWLWTQ